MNETEKRIISWGMDEKCLILHSEGTIVDVGKYTHLAFPHQRGIYIYPQGMVDYADSIEALRKSHIVLKRYCERCPYETSCDPQGTAVNNNKLWHSAVRPEKQRR